MTHIVPITLYGDYILTEWFLNSAGALYGDRLARGGVWSESDGFHDRYEKAYGVRIRFDIFGWVEHAEFTDREAAMEFMLRWS